MTETIRKKISALPHKPGIYLMRDCFGTVIYVSKVRDLHKRVSQVVNLLMGGNEFSSTLLL